MVALIGIFLVLASVLGGFVLSKGPVMALFVPTEYLVIIGTAVGTVVISTPVPVLKQTAAKLARVLKGATPGQAFYLTILKMLYELFQIARKDGLVALEPHIETPAKSTVFAKYPELLRDHHLTDFLCDSLRIVLVGSVPPHDLEAMLEAEIDVHHEDEERPVAALEKVADALPGIGIVAAVLGIVITMQAIAGPVEEIGHHVASALVGTFLGILLSYGFVHPLATNIAAMNLAESRIYYCLKAGVVAFAKGLAPIMCVEFARRSIFAADRPGFQAMEEACKSTRGK